MEGPKPNEIIPLSKSFKSGEVGRSGNMWSDTTLLCTFLIDSFGMKVDLMYVWKEISFQKLLLTRNTPFFQVLIAFGHC